MADPSTTALVIPEHDLEWTTAKGTGPGGQHKNTTESAVLVRHKPTGLVARCQSERSQGKNKLAALRVLRARVWDQLQAGRSQQENQSRRGQIGQGQRGDKRRTIRYQDGIVTDHILGSKWRLSDYLEGRW